MKSFIHCLPACLALIAATVSLRAATVPEPSTVIYGKVLHRSNGSETRITEGTLTWTLRDQTGAVFTYTTELEDIKGIFSYRINIPHQALASGLNADPSVIPLGVGKTRYDFVSIQVDGSPAEVLSADGDFLDMLQQSRAATRRIDLRVGFDLADTDGDGMPDWWEILHGLDWQTPDGGLDTDGDGWTNLNEYLNGSSPRRDDRVPFLHTKELAAYRESENGVWLRAIDTDTPPSGLVFTLTSPPAGGELRYDNGSGNAVLLETGGTFSQQDLNDGRVRFIHSEPQVRETTLAVSLSDGVHASQPAEVAVHLFAPDPSAASDVSVKQAPQWWRDENAVFETYWGLRENVLSGDFVESVLLSFMGSNYGWTLWDQRGHTLPVVIKATDAGSHFIIGGDSNDILSGGDQDDIISGGRGANRLSGAGGADMFVFSHAGVETVTDFDPLNDILDLGSLVFGKTGSLNSFLQAHYNGTETEIRVNKSGSGGTFTDATIRLQGVELVQDDLHRLWSKGQLLLGNVQGYSTVTIEGWPTQAIEEGYSTAQLTLRRQGPLVAPLTVTLAISGSASNGVDYNTLPSTVTFGAGKSTASLTVTPLTDSASEFTEQLNLGVVAGSGYVFGQATSGQIGIIDAKQRFNITPVDEYAVADGDPAYLRITRQGPRNGVVELLLSFSGSAVRNVDYQAINSLVTFADQQASKLVPVQALSLGELAGDEKSKLLTVAIRTPFEDEYLLGSSPSAGMRLLSDTENFEQWITEAVPSADATQPASAIYDITSPRTGLGALLEYASSYGLNLNDGVNAQERELLQPRLARDAGGMYFEFSKRLNDPRLQYVMERSSDMVHWRSDPSHFTPIPLGAASENRGRVRYRVVEPENEKLPFIRVRVSLKN